MALALDSSPGWAMSLAKVCMCCLGGRGLQGSPGSCNNSICPASSPGLGRHAEGRVEPINAVVLPRGKSLDQCAEILQKRIKEGQAGANRPPRCRRRKARPGSHLPPRNVFDFLNEKLQSQAPGALEAGVDSPGGKKSKDMYHASKSAKQALSLRLFQTEEKIERIQRDIRGIQEALIRNAGRYVWGPSPGVAMPTGHMWEVT